MNGMTTAPVAHFDLTGLRAIVLGSDTPAGATIAAAFTEAGADLALLPAALASRAGAATWSW